MAYVGNSPTQQSFTGGVDQYNGNNSNTVFGLTRTINTVYDVDAYVENVWQRPTTGYTVSANTITFTSAPPAGSNNVVVVYRNFSATSIVPQQGSVTHTAFAANAIPTALGYMPANKAGDTFSGAVSGITTLAAGNTTITGTANISQGLTSNTLTVSTNTATIGTTLYSVSNGNVGIGTATPGAGFDIAYSGAGAALRVYNSQATDPYGLLVDNTGANTSDANYIADFRVGGDSKFSIKNSGLVDVPAGQIKFPATQVASADANTLDDYEEGTWTPTLFHTNSNNASWGTRVGYYVKIGGIVHCWWLCDGGNSGTAGSGLKVSGLPFTTAATNLSYGTGGIWGTNGSTLSGNHFINAGSNLVQLYRGGNEYNEQQSFGSGYFTFRVT
jgi:hypothetical protein